MKQNIYDHPYFFKEYMALRESGVTYNDFIEQPAIKSLISSLREKTVLDLGCGTGQFAKFCIENGAAKVVGVDISKNMIEKAKLENSHEKIAYQCMPIEEIQFEKEQFDIIVSSLAIHYVEDYASLVGEVSRLLKNRGEFVFSVEHPIVTARKGKNHWVEDHEGNRLFYTIDNYQEEGKREVQWIVDGVVKYHRTIATLINTLIENGLMIEKVIEPQSIPEGLKKMPKVVNEKRKPTFIVIKSRKSPYI